MPGFAGGDGTGAVTIPDGGERAIAFDIGLGRLNRSMDAGLCRVGRPFVGCSGPSLAPGGWFGNPIGGNGGDMSDRVAADVLDFVGADHGACVPVDKWDK